MAKKNDWTKVGIGAGIILIGLLDVLPDEPITIPLGLGLIANGLNYI
jgi:hypothetical protein